MAEKQGQKKDRSWIWKLIFILLNVGILVWIGLNELNRGISRINAAVLNGQGTDKENELMSYYPAAQYDDMKNYIWVSVVADRETEDRAVALFKELVGDFPGVGYRTADLEDVSFQGY